MKRVKHTIGRKDVADFPELELYNIEVKIDTGAYTSAFHCLEIKETIIDGKNAIIFKLLDKKHPKFKDKEYVCYNFRQKRVKNTSGSSEMRYVIKTKIKLFDKEMPIEISLAERGRMKFPVLIGRKLLNGKFIVDTAKYDLSLKQKKTSIKTNN
ncbi:MAG: ATP-dependent zinc protease [Bacteroidales bacterium]|nr:ATP-dependent zinc protease [Bacteroidales bacterium]